MRQDLGPRQLKWLRRNVTHFAAMKDAADRVQQEREKSQRLLGEDAPMAARRPDPVLWVDNANANNDRQEGAEEAAAADGDSDERNPVPLRRSSLG